MHKNIDGIIYPISFSGLTDYYRNGNLIKRRHGFVRHQDNQASIERVIETTIHEIENLVGKDCLSNNKQDLELLLTLLLSEHNKSKWIVTDKDSFSLAAKLLSKPINTLITNDKKGLFSLKSKNKITKEYGVKILYEQEIE